MPGNKLQLYEVVKVKRDNTGSLVGKTGFITKMHQFPWNGVWEYEVFLFEIELTFEILEKNLESTGRFLTKEEIDKRLAIISNPHALKHMKL